MLSVIFGLLGQKKRVSVYFSFAKDVNVSLIPDIIFATYRLRNVNRQMLVFVSMDGKYNLCMSVVLQF